MFGKPKSNNQVINNCDSQFSELRNCIVREKKIFRSIFGDIDIKENPTAIPEYLDKHFKDKEKAKKERKMMGGDANELQDKIA